MPSPAPEIGNVLRHYRLVERIGAGGMGIVYRARDERLDRDVALKVLAPGILFDEPARKRFRREALALSKLAHPNIAMVFDFDTQNGVDFLVMEYIRGANLTDRLTSGALPEKEALAIGGQIATALEAAHEAGIIHCDLKPGNIMVTPKAEIKLLDFGLAKFVRVSELTATVSATRNEGLAGTLPYMAPEQLHGEPPDLRTDIFAFGAVLYEIATGRRPFQGRTSSALTDEILHRLPPPPGRVNPSLSPKLEDLILKCLEKEPDQRYQSSKELAVDLKRLTSSRAAFVETKPAAVRSHLRPILIIIGVTLLGVAALIAALNIGGLRERLTRRGAAPIQSVAVLPLQNLSHDPEQDYFVDGMTEEVIAELSKIASLRVISRTSVMQYKGAQRALPQIARELNVDAVIEGSVLRSQNRVRITAQLIRAATDQHLWAESYERDLGDVFALQEDVAHAIAREVQIKTSTEDETRLLHHREVSRTAHDLYLKGRAEWGKRITENPKYGNEVLFKSIQYFEQAIREDPQYALAYASMADSYIVLAERGGLPAEQAYATVRWAAAKAVEADDHLADAHLMLAAVKEKDWDWRAAEQEYQRAIALNPGLARAHHWYAALLSSTKRQTEAISEINRAIDLEPLSPSLYFEAVEVYCDARRFDDAMKPLQRLQDRGIYPEGVQFGTARVDVYKGMYGRAISGFQAMRVNTGEPSNEFLAYALARAGKRGEALQIVDKLQAVAADQRLDPPAVATAWMGLRNYDKAVSWLRRGFDTHSPAMMRVAVAPEFNELHSDPRFQDLVRRMGLPQ
jgi:TolB-like protein/Tfp pilus assembly protein PilF/predicted Ser/Thr protein kinase